MEPKSYTALGSGAKETNATVVRMRCPSCKKQGTFEPLAVQDLYLITGEGGEVVTGQRRCPNPDCHVQVFFIWTAEELVSYPPERIDFDATDLPDPVVKALTEAITCHATLCYTASAIMVRKTLEEVCRERGADGDSLKARLAALRDRVVLPRELLDGLDDLRLLGNDATHVESRVFDEVGKEEVELALDLTKEVLKAVYQYKSLLERLQARKKGATGETPG